jgi:hypothetical protein
MGSLGTAQTLAILMPHRSFPGRTLYPGILRYERASLTARTLGVTITTGHEGLLQDQGDFEGAWSLLDRALAFSEDTLGHEH